MLLDVAKNMNGRNDIVFYLVGDGMMKQQLDDRVREENISNVKILPLQSREDYFDIINSSDISIVSLDRRMKAPCLPGKLRSFMAVKQPIIAAVPNESETAKLIKESKCGVIVSPGNYENLKNTIIHLNGNGRDRENFGELGRKFLEENMNLEKNVETYEEIFHTMTDGLRL